MTTEERLEKLERQLADAPKVIRSNEFILEDDKGNVRAVLAVTKYGPQLCLYDENGKTLFELTGAVLGMMDENGKTRVELAVLQDGAGMALYDEDGNFIWQVP